MISGRTIGKIQAVLASLGLAFLLTLPAWFALVPSSHLTLYHLVLPATKPVEALLLDILCIFLLMSSLLYFADRLPAKLQLAVWACVSVVGLWILISFLAGNVLRENSSLFGNLPAWYVDAIGFWQRSRKLILAAVLAAVVALVFLAPRYARAFAKLSRFGMAGFGLASLRLIPYLISLAHAGGIQDHTFFSRVSYANQPSPQRRIIWILLDELSYDQSFEHPAAGINLPNLNHLRATSVSFGNLRPAGYYTDRVIPSLFLGRPIDDIRSTQEGQLEYSNGDEHGWIPFDSESTLFGLAHRNGWTTGIAGLYNPYCRILASELDTCYWEAMEKLPTQASMNSQGDSLLADAAALPMYYLTRLRSAGAQIRGQSLESFDHLAPHARTLIDNEQVRFVFLHFVVPHPPGIYDRGSHGLRIGGDYLDNLVLADDLLGSLLKEIDATRSAKDTTIIVSSDHSWRVFMWKTSFFWSEEEERASGGRFDDRPVFLIHFPEQQTEDDVNTSEPELVEHDLIAQMIEGRMNQASDVDRFLSPTEASR
jgi:hypothetical protein